MSSRYISLFFVASPVLCRAESYFFMETEKIKEQPKTKRPFIDCEKSQLSALSVKKQWPDAKIVSFPIETKLFPEKKIGCDQTDWNNDKKPGLSVQEIKNSHGKIFAVLMRSIPLTALDIDVKSAKVHKSAFNETEKWEFLKFYEIDENPIIQRTPNNGLHEFFKKRKDEKDKKLARGLEIKSDTLLFLWEFLPTETDLKELRDFPEEIITDYALGKEKGSDGPKEGGRMNWLNKNFWFAVENNDVYKMASVLLKSHNAGLTNQEIAGAIKHFKSKGIFPDLDAGQRQHEPEPEKEKVLNTLNALDKNKKVKDVKWLIKNFFEQGCLSIIAGMPGQGKTTLAIKFACINSMKREFWPGGPKGDGRPSLYICMERKKQSAVNKIYACGGTPEFVKVLDTFTIKGEKQKPDLMNPDQLELIIRTAQSGKYAFIIFDPLVNLELKGQNKNEEVRPKMEKILSALENSNTVLLGIMHLKKERKFTDDLGSIRGASEWENVAGGVFKIKELKDDQGYLMVKLKVNESDTGTAGGIKFLIESITIPECWIAPDQKEKTKGGIRNLELIDKPKRELDKLTVKEFLDAHADSPEDKIRRVIQRLEAEKKELNTSIIKELARAEGVTGYYLNNRLNWSSFGYQSQSSGQGKDFKKILKKL